MPRPTSRPESADVGPVVLDQQRTVELHDERVAEAVGRDVVGAGGRGEVEGGGGLAGHEHAPPVSDRDVLTDIGDEPTQERRGHQVLAARGQARDERIACAAIGHVEAGERGEVRRPRGARHHRFVAAEGDAVAVVVVDSAEVGRVAEDRSGGPKAEGEGVVCASVEGHVVGVHGGERGRVGVARDVGATALLRDVLGPVAPGSTHVGPVHQLAVGIQLDDEPVQEAVRRHVVGSGRRGEVVRVRPARDVDRPRVAEGDAIGRVGAGSAEVSRVDDVVSGFVELGHERVLDAGACRLQLVGQREVERLSSCP